MDKAAKSVVSLAFSLVTFAGLSRMALAIDEVDARDGDRPISARITDLKNGNAENELRAVE